MKTRISGIASITLALVVTKANAVETDTWMATASGCMVSVPSAIAKTVTVNWTGACSDGYADGKGVLTWSNGNRYEGELLVGTINGKGTFYWANGDWYQGEFKKGRREGMGVQHFACSGSYRGQFHNGVMDGVGVLDLADGNHYEGRFHDGLMEGLGVRSFADGSRYEGEFRRNQQEGLGALVLKNNAHYEGEFMNGQPEGHALVTYPDGGVYEGMYVDGHVDGRGIMTKLNGERDVGFFKDNKGVLKVVSNIGPALYEPCSTHCNTTTPSCGSNAAASIAPDDPMYQIKVTNAAITCGRELQQCVTMCERENPTAHELKGIVEVGELDDAKNDSASKDDAATKQAKAEARKVAVSFVDEQLTATGELRRRLAAQRQQLRLLQQQIANLPAMVTTAGNGGTDCKSQPRRNKS